MASTGVMNGTLIGLYIDGVKVAKSTSCKIGLARATRNTTNKDSGSWQEVEYGLGSGSLSGDFLDAEDSAFNYSDLFNILLNKTKVTAKWSSEVSGDKYYQALCLLTKVDKDAPMEENVSGSYELQITGTPQELTVA